MNEPLTKKYFVCVSGNIGCGKTTVTNLLAEVFKFRKFEEEVEDNPYLALFYHDMKKWSYRLQRFFLFSRALTHEKINMFPNSAIQDRSIYEDMDVFAKNQLKNNLWTEEEYEKYTIFCSMILKELEPPDLLVFLHASMPTLRERIKKRGRAYESQMIQENDPYLLQLQELYLDWFKSYKLGPKLMVHTDNLNFVDNPEHIQKLISGVRNCLVNKDTSLTKYIK
ncbi:MAG: deoxynucleoside kinase [Nanoarchaeota archaeon]